MDTTKLDRMNELLGKVGHNMQKVGELRKELTKAITMQEIWPDAFEGDNKCSLMTVDNHDEWYEDTDRKFSSGRPIQRRKTGHRIKEAHLKRTDGEVYPLTRQELGLLKDPIQIHKRYERCRPSNYRSYENG